MKISIIVPIYNSELYLDKCIKSILSQTYKEIEIILIDDGSKDNSGQICDKYSSIDNRIKVIHEENRGLSAARNRGQELSTGEWIMFVDADDWIEADMCNYMVEKAYTYSDVELIMCEWVKDYNGHLQYYKYKFEDNELFEGKKCKLLQGYMLDSRYNIGTAYAKLIKKQYLINNNITHDKDIKQGIEGVVFNLKLFDKLNKAIFVAKPFYHYIYNKNSITAKMNNETIELMQQGFERIDNYINININNKFLENNFCDRVLSGIITSALRGYFNPNMKFSFSKRKAYMNSLINKPVIKKYINIYGYNNSLSYSRKIILLFIKKHLYYLLFMAAILRSKQLNMK